jgi:hypothetical protein
VNCSGLTPALYNKFSFTVITLDVKYVRPIIPVINPDKIYFEYRHVKASEIEVRSHSFAFQAS